MRVLYLTVGRGAAYFGSCLHDNALVTELRRRGIKVDFHSVFQPLASDEPRATKRRVFLSGLSLFLQSQAPPFRYTPYVLDRLLDNRLVLDLLRARLEAHDPARWAHAEPGSATVQLAGNVLVSALRGAEGEVAKEVRRLVDAFRRRPPTVVLLSHGFLLGLAEPLKRRFGCPVVVALQDELSLMAPLEKHDSFEALELMRAHLAHVDLIVARRQSMVKRLNDWFALPADRVRVVLPSINVRGWAPPVRPDNAVFTVGYCGRIAPEKGVHLLCDAYIRLRADGQLPASRFMLAGSLSSAHGTYLDVMRQRMANLGLSSEFSYVGELDRSAKFDFLSRLDVFSMPAASEDELGLPVLEAMSAGVPVVQPRRGVFPELVTRAGGGIVVSPSDEEALAAGLVTIYRDPVLGRELGRRGAAGVRAHFSIEREADEIMRVADSLINGRTVPQEADTGHATDPAATPVPTDTRPSRAA